MTPQPIRPLSPIERLIDQATGYRPAPAAVPPRLPAAPPNLDAETKALLAVADAAKRWHCARASTRAAREKALHEATKEWIRVGG